MRRLVVTAEMPTVHGGIYLNHTNFSKAKQFLGQEHPFAIYDMRVEGGVCLNLEALAIVAGTIQENGTLYLVCPDWETLKQQIDMDSRRWNAGKPIACPNFYRHFKALVEKYRFSVEKTTTPPPASGRFSSKFCKFTDEQQQIFNHLPHDAADIHLITAPRGRGKSTLSGKLAQQFAKQAHVLITARSHAALPNFWRAVESEKLPFFAPDKLLQHIENKAISADSWLFIDEAASLPLPMLHAFCAYFNKVILTTTTHNYEGTGRGFSLKFLPPLTRSHKTWQLTTPLRWGKNDSLEQFVDELLLLDEKAPLFRKKGMGEICRTSFYHLLANAHYKTTPTDLRRLFDADDQFLHAIHEKGELIGGIWAVKEGGLNKELAHAIWRGERRPSGNLVAQYLCFQGNLPEACQLHSVRISRIAVLPERQHQGIGKQLVADFLQKIQKKEPLADYLSVSFGVTETLFHFWQRCGFALVQITPNKEASSGYQSAMMLYPLSEQGRRFVTQAKQAFERDVALLPFLQNILKKRPLADLKLTETDWRNLRGFAFSQRTLSACLASLTRLAQAGFLTNYSEKLNNQDDFNRLSKTDIQQLKRWLAMHLQEV